MNTDSDKTYKDKVYNINNNILKISEKSTKKDDGINSVLTLLKDLRDFQDKVESTLDSLIEHENKKILEKHINLLSSMYQDLITIAQKGVKNIRLNEDNLSKPNYVKKIL